jgi:hypothetical protein
MGSPQRYLASALNQYTNQPLKKTEISLPNLYHTPQKKQQSFGTSLKHT